MVPLIAAHKTASQTSTSGSAGFSGGFLPVAARQDVLSVFFATAAAVSAATSENSVHIFEPPDAMLTTLVARHEGPPHPGSGVAAGPMGRPLSAAARASGCREPTSQYGVASAGSVTGTRTARLR